MDINHFVKIRIIPSVNPNGAEFFKGIICRKNILHKKMKKEIVAPNIFLISGNLDCLKNDQNQQSWDSKQCVEIVDKIQLYKPDIVILDGFVNHMAMS